MMFVAWLASALAAPPLVVQVVPDGAVRGPLPVGPSRREVVDVTPADVVVDGVREAAWDRVRPGPPLDALLEGPEPPALSLRVARVPGGLVVLHLPLPPGWRAALIFDPDGTATEWTEVALGTDVRFMRCSLGEVTLPMPFPLPHRAAPCAPVEGVAASGADGVEVVLSTEGWTGAARLLWTVEGPGGAGGTWARSGQVARVPEQGRWLDLGRAGMQATVTPDAAEDRVLIEVTEPGREAPSWRLGAQGRVIATGVVPPDGRFAVPWLADAEPWLELRQSAGDPPAARVVRLPWRRPALWPVVRTSEGWVLAYEAPDAVTTAVTVRDARGRVVSGAEVALAQGSGTLVLSQVPRRGRSLTVDGLGVSDLDLEDWPQVADPEARQAR